MHIVNTHQVRHRLGDRTMTTGLERWLALARTSRTRARIRHWMPLDRVMSERRMGGEVRLRHNTPGPRGPADGQLGGWPDRLLAGVS